MSSHAARSEACFAVAVYSACSASMLIVNKLAVHHLPAPAFVTLMQFVATALVVLTGSALGLVSVDTSEWSRIKFFIVYVCAFSAGTWSAQMQRLHNLRPAPPDSHAPGR
jgi:hypothetical protein